MGTGEKLSVLVWDLWPLLKAMRRSKVSTHLFHTMTLMTRNVFKDTFFGLEKVKDKMVGQTLELVQNVAERKVVDDTVSLPLLAVITKLPAERITNKTETAGLCAALVKGIQTTTLELSAADSILNLAGNLEKTSSGADDPKLKTVSTLNRVRRLH